MRWLVRLVALIAVAAALGGGRSGETLAASGSGGALVIDCNTVASGVQSACAYAAGATFSVRVNVAKAPAGGFFAHQTKVRWNDAQIDYLPASDLATENLWSSCTFPVRRDNQTGGPADPSVLYACVPFPQLAQGETAAGPILQLQLRCQQNGATSLTLVPRLGDTQLGSHFLDANGSAIDPALTAATVTCGPAYAVAWGADATPASMNASDTANIALAFTNAGSMTWPAGGANPVRLSYHWRAGACPGTSTAVWDGRRATLPGDIAPSGAVSGLPLQIVTPSTAGTYCLVYDLVHEGVAWFSGRGAATLARTVTVNPRSYGVTWGAHTTPASITEGATVGVNLSFTNTSTFTWPVAGANPVRLSYHWRTGACPGTGTAVWDGRRAALPGDTVSGATIAGLPLQLAAPATAGTYCLVYDLVHEGVAWFSGRGASTLPVTVTITERPYDVAWGAHTTPATMAAGTQVGVNVSFTNAGGLTWPSGGPNPVRLSYHWRAGACPGTSTAVWDGQRAVLPGDVATGGTVSGLPLQIVTPLAPGPYCLVYDLVHEGVTWFGRQGAATLAVSVTVS